MANDGTARARRLRRRAAVGRLHHDNPLLAWCRYRGGLRTVGATEEPRRSARAGTAIDRASNAGGGAVMDDIIAGVRTFQRDVYPQYRELFKDLAAGQSPEALVI